MNVRSLAFRLSVWYVLLLSVIFVVVATGMYFGLTRYLTLTINNSQSRRIGQIEEILQSAAPGVTKVQIADAVHARFAPEANNRFVRITQEPRILIYRSGYPGNRSFDPSEIPPPVGGPWPQGYTTRRITTDLGAVQINATPVYTPSGRYLVELGNSLQQSDSVQEFVFRLLAALLPVLVAFAAGGGYLLVRRALRPVERMSQIASQISLQNLDVNLPVMQTGDALQQLSLSLNHMLRRLRESVQSSRRFLADASHELRTPLAVVGAELQEVVREPHDAAEMRERIGSALEELTRLERLVLGLLALSRLDAGEAQREWLEFDLGELAASTVEQMRLVAEDRGVRLDASGLGVLKIQGDRSRLKQVIVNLLDNAIKFTPSAGEVSLRTEQHADMAVLEVRDTGIGIPPEALPHLFERFYRVDEARTRDYEMTGGAGLGLSIVHSICAAHGARIEVESAPATGSCFRLKFPPSHPLPLPAKDKDGSVDSTAIDASQVKGPTPNRSTTAEPVAALSLQ